MKKMWILAMSFLCIFLVGCGEEKNEIWQWAYYPEWYTHYDGEQTYWPIFTNYQACEDRAVDLYNRQNRAVMCMKNCDSVVDGLPKCEDVVRSWKPLEISKVFSWIDLSKGESTKDLLWFLLETEDLYCGYKVTLLNFLNWPKEDWYQNSMINWNDIPSQRILGQRMLNYMEQQNFFTRIENYKKNYQDNWYFSDTVRNLWLLHDYLYSAFTKDTNLMSYEQFTQIMYTDINSSTNIIQWLPSTLEREYNGYVSENQQQNYKLTPKDQIELSRSIADIETVCNLSMY